MDYVKKLMLKKLEERGSLKKFEDFRQGDTVNVFVKVKEGEKERVQVYRGVVLKIQGSGIGKCFTVRKVSAGVGVERTFPFASTKLDRVEVVSRGRTRRARIFFLRDRTGRSARLNTELTGPAAEAQTTAATPQAE